MKKIITNPSKTLGLVQLSDEKAEVIGSFDFDLLQKGLDSIIKVHELFTDPITEVDGNYHIPHVKVEIAFAKYGKDKNEVSHVLLMKLADFPGTDENVGWIAIAPMKDHTVYVDKTAGD